MIFNSLQFTIFFVFVYVIYVFSKHKFQNRLLLVASYVFYGSWDYRFLSLIVLSTIVDYFCGIKIHETDDVHKRKVFLFISIISNLTILGVFKYFNFFITNFENLIGTLGWSVQPNVLNIVLPVGISFYTFQTMSYTIDVYRRELSSTRKFFDFALFVAFFPQLVAGPIERAKHLLPQMLTARKLSLDKFYEGSYLIFWGLFQKMFIADNLARYVDSVFSASGPYNGVEVLVSLYAFAFQIFCDFAGYSNIARGLGKCLGFEIIINFNLPYFSTNPKEFWQRWHISLSSWLRDYLYIPLGGSKNGQLITYRNISITMLLGGLWHGAAWTFILWGFYQGFILIMHRLLQPILEKVRLPANFILNKMWFVARVIFFFHFVCIGWLIFRAQSINQIFEMLKAVIINNNVMPNLFDKYDYIMILCFIGILVCIQIVQYIKKDLMAIYHSNTFAKILIYVAIFYMLIIGGVGNGKEFIYFQF